MKLIIIIVTVITSLFYHCSSHVAGTETETQTGKPVAGLFGSLVFENGNPAEAALVKLYENNDTTFTTLDSTTTDSAGAYLFSEIPTGYYKIRGEYIALTDTLYALITKILFDSVKDLGTDTLYAPGYISGRVNFNQPNKMGAAIYIPGSSYSAYSNQDGLFVISGVPAGAYWVAYTKPGYLTYIDSNVTVIANDTTNLMERTLVRDPNQPPPPPVGLALSYDTLRSITRISWNAVHDNNLSGYIVFRKDTAFSAQYPEKISGDQLVTDTIFFDTIHFEPLDTIEKVFQYQVKTQDKNNELSAFSVPVLVSVSPKKVPFDGLVAWYPFNGSASDRSGNGNNGLLFGPELSYDRFNRDSNSYFFNDSSAYISCGNNKILDCDTSISISLWIKSDNWKLSDYSTVIQKGFIYGNISEAAYGLHYHNGKNRLQFYCIDKNNTGHAILSPDSLETGKWYHIAAIYSGKQMALYINGNMASSFNSTFNIKTVSNELIIGGKKYNQLFSGSIDDICIYNRALTDKEIFELYHKNGR